MMENPYTMSLSADDFLRHQLYIASRSRQIKRKVIIGWIVWVIVFGLLSGMAFSYDSQFAAYYTLIMCVAFLLFFPTYTRFRYKRHYQRFIAEHYVEKFDVPGSIQFSEDQIVMEDKTGEGKINLSEVDRVVEIPENLFIRMSTGNSLIIPKNMERYEDFKKDLSQRLDKLGTSWDEELDWKWTIIG